MFGEKKKFMKHISVNRLLLFIYTMAMLFSPHGCTLETKSRNTSCDDKLTCFDCTIKDQCSWFIAQQRCIQNLSVKCSSLLVNSKEKCPRFSVVTEYEDNYKNSSLKYIVKVTKHNSVGFINLLNNRNFICNSTRIDKSANNTDEIVCSTSFKLNYFMEYISRLLAAFLFYVKYKGIILQLDNFAKSYETIYEHQCVEDRNNENCGTCTWNDDDSTHCIRLCSYKDFCEGNTELYINHDGFAKIWDFTSRNVNDRCAEIKVRDVNPLSGTMAGGTTITITVTNHRIFANNRNVMVTVAGTVCANIESTAKTITCTTTPPADDAYEPPSGTVVVKYMSKYGRMVLKIESSQVFQFYVGTTCGSPHPVLSLKQELYGLDSGGTTVTLNGFRFIKPCVTSRARMFVNLPNGTKQFASSYCDPPVHDMYINCRTPQLNSSNGWNENVPNFTRVLNFGLEVINGNQSFYVNGPLISYYHILDDYPVLENFEIKVGGSVAVYGKHLRYMHPDVLIRFQDSLAKGCKVTSTAERSFVCMPNTTVVVSKEMFVNIGGLYTYNVTKLPYDFSKLIRYSIAPWIMVVVLALVCFYQINSRSDAHKTVHNLHVNTKGLETQTLLFKS